MIPLIQQSLAIGWTAKQILNFISRKMNNLSPGLENARRSGYRDEDILKFLQGKIKTGKVSDPTTAYGKYLKKSGILTPEESKERKAKGIKAAIGTGVTALAAYKAYKNFSGTQPTAGPTPIQPDEIQVGEQIGFQPPSPVAQPTEQEPQPIQPTPTPQVPIETQEQQPNPQSLEIVDRMKYGNIIDQLAEKNESPEMIAGVVDNLLGQKGRSWLKRQTKEPLEKIISDYITIKKDQIEPISEGVSPEPEQKQPPGVKPPEIIPTQEPTQQPPPTEFKPIKEPIQPIEPIQPREETSDILDRQLEKRIPKSQEIPKFEPSIEKKGDSVSNKDGEVGKIEGIDGSGVLVRIDGKLKKVQFKDLKGQSELVKQAKIVVDPFDIPEEERSAALGFVLTPPDKRDIMISHGPSGKFYRYWKKDGSAIDQSLVDQLKVGQTLPISSGETYMGAWDSEKEDSRGTVAYHQLTKQAQKTGTSDDKSKDYWFQEMDSTFIHGYIKKFLKLLQGGVKAL